MSPGATRDEHPAGRPRVQKPLASSDAWRTINTADIGEVDVRRRRQRLLQPWPLRPRRAAVRHAHRCAAAAVGRHHATPSHGHRSIVNRDAAGSTGGNARSLRRLTCPPPSAWRACSDRRGTPDPPARAPAASRASAAVIVADLRQVGVQRSRAVDVPPQPRALDLAALETPEAGHRRSGTNYGRPAARLQLGDR